MILQQKPYAKEASPVQWGFSYRDRIFLYTDQTTRLVLQQPRGRPLHGSLPGGLARRGAGREMWLLLCHAPSEGQELHRAGGGVHSVRSTHALCSLMVACTAYVARMHSAGLRRPPLRTTADVQGAAIRRWV